MAYHLLASSGMDGGNRALCSIVAWVAVSACGGGSGGEPDAACLCDAPVVCRSGERCTDEVCMETPTSRCECAAHGGFFVCESTSCPDVTVTEGTGCTMPGLVCDPDFEFAGFRCIAPENVFAACLPGGTLDSRCPFDVPAQGTPCCWILVGTLDPCTYATDPGGAWSCVGEHWSRASM